MKYISVPRQLTPKTLVYRVVDENQKFVASFGKQVAAENFAKYLNTNNISTLNEWRKQPHKVKIAFISATMQTEPNLPIL